MTALTSSETGDALHIQRALWRRQGATLPTLHGGKRSWFRLVLELIDQIDAGMATASGVRPNLPEEIFSETSSRNAAVRTADPLSWGEYSRFLKSTGLAQAVNGELALTNLGQEFIRTRSARTLGKVLASRYRLFAEALLFISKAPAKVEDLDAHLRSSYETNWGTLGGTRGRIDWLDALRAIEPIEGRAWRITATGESILADCEIVTPEALDSTTADTPQLAEAPPVIADLLNGLVIGARSHASRSTYNIWVPSPAGRPNKVENLRTVVNAAVDRLDREELLGFIATTFALRRSSVDSMLPFLRASGLIQEVGLGVFQATSYAQAWLQSDDDINFVRILHANMRFVGEMLQVAQSGVLRAEVYEQAGKFGLNVDKSRWIAAFLQDTGLLEQPKYGSLRTTSLGLALLAELPLAAQNPDTDTETSKKEPERPGSPRAELYTDVLDRFSRSPMALEMAAGKALELSIRDCFLAMGFEAHSISGSGATDVLVRWSDETGNESVAIVEAKSRATGSVAHTDVSDVAIETHKSAHGAGFVAIVGPGFSGDTIRNMAIKRNWVLLEAARLGLIADEAIALGISPATTSLMFSPGGLDELDEALRHRRRELTLVSFVVSQLAEEARATGEAITPRDISRDGRGTELRPSVDEVLDALNLLRNTAPGTIRIVDENRNPKFSGYVLGAARPAASALRAVAQAIELPLQQRPSE